jgi:signal transduction histidine kinase
MASAETGSSSTSPLETAENRQPGGEILAAYGLYFADEALSSVRHEVLNRMTALGALSFELRRGLEPTRVEIRARLEDLNRQIGLVCESVARRLAGPRVDPPPRCQVRRVFEQVAALCRAPVDFQVFPPPRSAVAIEPLQLAVALLCVLENAVQACRVRRRPCVELRCEAQADNRLGIEVLDNGPGIEPDVELRAFDRFFSTKPGHAGLGLCVARTLLMRWRGDIQLRNRDDGEAGVQVTLLLPSAGPRGKRGKLVRQ